MKAVRLYAYGGPELLRYELDAPEPALKPDSVLIETAATSVNPIDWKVRSGTRQKDFPLSFPAILGRDVSGTVRAIGNDVRGFTPGDRVIAMADATYAQYVVVPAALVAHLPDGVDPIDAAAIPLVCLTGDQLVRRATGAVAGDTIIVSGALGSVGRAAVHVAREIGATVIAGVRARQKAEAESLGASEVLAIDDEAAIERLGPVDGVADTIGGDTAARLLAKVRPGGRFGFASVLPENASSANPTVDVSRVSARPDAATLRGFADDIRDGSFVLPVSRRLRLDEAGAAQQAAERGGAGKIVLIV